MQRKGPAHWALLLAASGVAGLRGVLFDGLQVVGEVGGVDARADGRDVGRAAGVQPGDGPGGDQRQEAGDACPGPGGHLGGVRAGEGAQPRAPLVLDVLAPEVSVGDGRVLLGHGAAFHELCVLSVMSVSACYWRPATGGLTSDYISMTVVSG